MCQRGQGYPGKWANREVGWRGARREMPADFEEAYTILEDCGRFCRKMCVWVGILSCRTARLCLLLDF